LLKVKELKVLSDRSIEGSSRWHALSERGRNRMRMLQIVCFMPREFGVRELDTGSDQ
jgi:hypothetical protein